MTQNDDSHVVCTADWSLSSHILFIIMLSVPLYSSPPDHLRVQNKNRKFSQPPISIFLQINKIRIRLKRRAQIHVYSCDSYSRIMSSPLKPSLLSSFCLIKPFFSRMLQIYPVCSSLCPIVAQSTCSSPRHIIRI